MIEQFTAAAMCPRCGAVDVFPWREPQPAPRGDEPVARVQRRIAAVVQSMCYTDKPYFDPDDAVVIRQCRCGHEWAQQ